MLHPTAHVLGNFRQLEGTITAARVLEVDDLDPKAVPQVVREIAVTRTKDRRNVPGAPAPSPERASHFNPASKACLTGPPARGRAVTAHSFRRLTRSPWCPGLSGTLQTTSGGTASYRVVTALAKATILLPSTAVPRKGAPARRDITTTGSGAARSASRGSGASPGAYVASKDKARHSRSARPPSFLGNRLITRSPVISTEWVPHRPELMRRDPARPSADRRAHTDAK